MEEAHSDTLVDVIEEKITLEMFEDIPEINDSDEDNEVNMIETNLIKCLMKMIIKWRWLFNLIDSMYEKEKIINGTMPDVVFLSYYIFYWLYY